MQNLRKLGSIPKESYFANYNINNQTLAEKNFISTVHNSVSVTLKFNSSHLCNHNYATMYNFNFSVKQDKRFNGLWICETGSFIFAKSSFGFEQTFIGKFLKII